MCRRCFQPVHGALRDLDVAHVCPSLIKTLNERVFLRKTFEEALRAAYYVMVAYLIVVP